LKALIADSFSGGEAITVPVTVAWGEKDRLLLPSQAYTAAAEIPSARMVLLRGCGHVPTYDDPDQVASVLLRASAR
jgi:pimeloyl-ACP methyl ester carboxylesterase